MENYSSSVGPGAKDKVEEMILEEIEAGNYVLSDCKPVIVSALGAVPKPDSDDLRVIHDCSMPPGRGVNTYIEIEKQSFQTLDDAAKLIGRHFYIAKVDLRRAYRSVPVHPSNYKALGLKWQFKGHKQFSYLVDTRLPFGASSAPGIFHRLTQSVRRMMVKRGFHGIIVYLDDFLIIGQTYEECKRAFDTLCELLVALGFTISPSKVVKPCQTLTFLGVEINTTNLSFSLPKEKIKVLKEVLLSFCDKKRASKRQLQQLAGRLNWACKVVYGGRTFLRRILDLMNTLQKQSSKCLLSQDFYHDIDWWLCFLEEFNGQCPFHDTRPVNNLHTDACNSGIGAAFEGDWFYSNLLVDHPDVASMHINFKEAFCVVSAIERWAPLLRNKRVHIYCDNTAAVAMLNKGTTKNRTMMVHLRRVFWCSAVYNFRLRVFHVPGKLNILADHISRLHLPVHFNAFYQYLGGPSFRQSFEVQATDHMSWFSFFFLLGLYSTSVCFSSAF